MNPIAIRPSLRRFHQVGFSMADQALSVGGIFLINLVLARTQSREEYGMFVLSYSVLIFLMGLHNAAILEPFTVYGSGRHASRLAQYFRLMCRVNLLLGLVCAALLVGLALVFHGPPAFIGMGLAVSLIFSGALLRRNFYLQRRAALSATASLVFFLMVSASLWLTARTHLLNSLSIFLVLAAGWAAAGISLAGRLPRDRSGQSFMASYPGYWREHWTYARWVLLTAAVFQLTTQGYYWLVAGLLSVRDVAALKAVSLVVAPADQIFIALNYLVLPRLSADFAAHRIASLLTVWKWYAGCILAANISFVLGIRWVGKPLLHQLYGGRYDGSASLLSVLSLLPAVMGVGHTMNAALKAAEGPRMVFWAYVCSGTITFMAGIPLVTRFGLRGAVYGMILSGASYTAALSVGFFLTFRSHLSLPSVRVAAGSRSS